MTKKETKRFELIDSFNNNLGRKSNKGEMNESVRDMDEREAVVALLTVAGVGPKRFYALMDEFGSAREVWNNKSSGRLRRLLPATVAASVSKGPNLVRVREIDKTLSRLGAWLLFLGDEGYPEFLGHIDDPPPVLFGIGRRQALLGPCVAVVGSRKASTYGQKVCTMFSKGLAERGVTVVSGLAIGIDTWAHRACLDAGGVTVAVKGCGIDVDYPVRNVALMKSICETGAVVTEFLPGQRAEPRNFPRRNRIISGLCQGVVVIEAGTRSGSLITAYYAMEQGRDVMAVPGNIFSYGSRGCHRLIKEGAYMVETPEEVLEILGLEGASHRDDDCHDAEGAGGTAEMDGQMALVVDKLEAGPQHIDEIAASCSLSVSKVASILTELELKDVVVALGGGIYTLQK